MSKIVRIVRPRPRDAAALRRRLLLLLVVVGFAGLAGMFMLQAPVGPALEGTPKGFVLGDVSRPVPDVRFTDGERRQ